MNRPRLTLRVVLLVAVLIVIVIVGAFVFITSLQPNNNPQAKVTVTFDFDSGSPSLDVSQNTPFSQTKDNITVSFSSPSDPDAFIVNNNNAAGLTLSQFSGKYLFDNKNSNDILDIKFSDEILDATLTFATVEHQSETIKIPSDILITAYRNNSLVGSQRAYGSFSSDSYPQGTISFFPGIRFNWIRVSMPTQSSGTNNFLIDNIVVSPISKPPT